VLLGSPVVLSIEYEDKVTVVTRHSLEVFRAEKVSQLFHQVGRGTSQMEPRDSVVIINPG
jgi:hypothetical protein